MRNKPCQSAESREGACAPTVRALRNARKPHTRDSSSTIMVHSISFGQRADYNITYDLCIHTCVSSGVIMRARVRSITRRTDRANDDDAVAAVDVVVVVVDNDILQPRHDSPVRAQIANSLLNWCVNAVTAVASCHILAHGGSRLLTLLHHSSTYVHVYMFVHRNSYRATTAFFRANCRRTMVGPQVGHCVGFLLRHGRRTNTKCTTGAI